MICSCPSSIPVYIVHILLLYLCLCLSFVIPYLSICKLSVSLTLFTQNFKIKLFLGFSEKRHLCLLKTKQITNNVGFTMS